MFVETRHFALILALMISLVQTTVPLVGAHRRWAGWMDVAGPAAQAQLMCLTLSFGALTWAFVTSDFSVALVAENSHSAKPMLYKVTGVWGNHEGSLLLWAWTLALFGALVAWRGQTLPPDLRARVVALQGAIGAAFLAFMLFTSNPFLRTAVPPLDGRDLNPLLQHPGLAFHPPLLYLGYVGLSVCFSFAVAALLGGRVDAAWARWVRPWTLTAWAFLTAGIGLGAWWAYAELGWGGAWFWDPVENASLMPWLLAVTLLHSAIVSERRGALKSWTLLLAILAFGFSLIGTFIVRSGVLTSVHAFASDPDRGLVILAITAVFVGGALTLYAARAGRLGPGGVFAPVSRESALVLNNILLSVTCGVIFLGTIWPLVAELAFGRVLSVGPPFFNTAAAPFALALGLLMPLGALVPWKRGTGSRLGRRLAPAAALGLALAGLAWAIGSGSSLLAPIGFGLGGWIVAGSFTDLVLRARGTPARLMRLPGSDWGRGLAHAGVGILVAAVAGHAAWEIEDVRAIAPGDTWALGGYTLALEDVDTLSPAAGRNYTATRATVRATGPDGTARILTPEVRAYPVAGMRTTEAAILSRWNGDLYVVLGAQQDDGRWALRSWIKPLTAWLWIGTGLMVLGGAVSLGDRRFRLGVAAPRSSRSHTQRARDALAPGATASRTA